MKKLIFVCFFIAVSAVVLRADWPTCGANPQRTASVTEEIRGALSSAWYRPVEPYMNYKMQMIAADNKIFASTARGLYCLNAADGTLIWVYPTEIPLGHSPTYNNGKLYVGSYDRTIHCIDVTGANAGKKTAGWNPYVALAGFETNPLVVDAGQGTRVYAGNRDGYFYCLDANTGALIWRYKTDCKIKYTAAMDANKVIYFASDDLYAYALSDAGASPTLVWKSSKLMGAGFGSYWPVVYRNWVIFTGEEDYYGWPPEGIHVYLHNEDQKDIGGNGSISFLGATGTELGDWATGTVTIDAGRICEYYEQKPYRRRIFMLARADGKEYTYDSDNDGNPEYAPFTWSSKTGNGSKYPPVVGNDDVLYPNIAFCDYNSWVNRTAPSGWKLGTKYISWVATDTGWASDEPAAYSVGGKVMYLTLCGDREFWSFDLTVPRGQANRLWQTWTYNGRYTLFPNYEPMYYNDDMDGWAVYGSSQGNVNKHGTRNPPVPYNGRIYLQMGNSICALHTGTNAAAPLSMAAIQPVTDTAPAVSVSDLKQKLADEIQKMISAGHLKPGCFKGSYADNNLEQTMMIGGLDHFSNPADTMYTLAIAMPHLSTALQQQLKIYMRSEMAAFPITDVVHTGYQTGAWRQPGGVPPDIEANITAFGPQSSGQLFNWGIYYTPFSFYGAWKYAQVFPEEAPNLFNTLSQKNIEVPGQIGGVGGDLNTAPWLYNESIAGYRGYMELEKLAGRITDITQSSKYSTYVNLVNTRVNGFSHDSPYIATGGTGVNMESRGKSILNMSRNYIHLVPELAEELRSSKLSEVQASLAKINNGSPYWFVEGHDEAILEAVRQNLYDQEIFKARAMILKEPYAQLIKYLDAPLFQTGDLFYIQHLVYTIESVPLVAAKINASANPALLEADGTSASIVNARICNDADQLVTASNASVTFTVTNGTGTLIGANPVTASGGIAAITYRSGITEQTVTITAASNGLTQGAVNIALVRNDPPGAPTNLLCNGLPAPTGVTDASPGLSWAFSDPQAGQGDAQKSYQLIVADSQSGIDSNNGNVWDTNRVDSSANAVTYSGTALKGKTQYYWKVRTYDTMSAAGPYSAAAVFTMGDIDPVITASPTVISFGEIGSGTKKDAAFSITNSGSGMLTGNITSDGSWLTTEPASFSLAAGTNITIKVSVDNGVLNRKSGTQTGKLTIKSNTAPAGDIEITVQFTATCVLVKPNPVRLSSPLVGEGGGEGCITFYGDGIVPGKTTIKIYTLTGELIDVIATAIGAPTILSPDPVYPDSSDSHAGINQGRALATLQSENEITWTTSNLSPGIYIYTYASPKEKGIAKFTVIK